MSKIIIPQPLTKDEVKELNLLLNHINRANNLMDYISESDANRYNFERIRVLNLKQAERKEFVTSFFSPN
jgi:hypothetical protein